MNVLICNQSGGIGLTVITRPSTIVYPTKISPNHNTSCIFKGYTVKPVLRGHLWEKDKVAL